ncbi:hypothetical protein J31TS4_17230 [Paenibacillus sp. J31TS4]|nr:hypothetical protein J31TS4_17230 [Paenibacillus sp. J31TS4]
MFKCTCGGIMIVKEIEPYPPLTSQEKLSYDRKCTVECSTCKKIITGQKYD